MLLGLVTDVHNHAAELSAACDYFQSRDVDQILTIGDTCDIFGSSAGAQEVARLLIQHHVIGVWGNHDYPFCWDIEADTRERYPEIVFQAMGAMKPRWTI
jgi:predicted phosphodiesterase